MYRISDVEEKKLTYEKMVEREINQGYVLAIVNFHPADSSEDIQAAVYIALPDDSACLRDTSLEIQVRIY